MKPRTLLKVGLVAADVALNFLDFERVHPYEERTPEETERLHREGINRGYRKQGLDLRRDEYPNFV